LPLNPQALANISPDSSFNTAVSFVANTNWQGYSGEQTMSYLSQMLVLTGQNFFSAATGIAVAFALIRGFSSRSAKSIGNFWIDITRSTLYLLLPLSLIFAVFLMGQGVIQNFSAYKDVNLMDPVTYSQPKNSPDGQGPAGHGNADRYHPEHRDGTGRLAGSDQDDRHQRRWLLQRQLRAPV
jgi:K+-transporting ATPase ATPase A chain